MPLCYLRRPLFLLAVFYMAVLSILHSRGYFEAAPPQNLLDFCRDPEVALQGLVAAPLTRNHRGQKTIIRALRIDDAACDQRIQVYFHADYAPAAALRPGQTVILTGRLRLPRSARNPGEFDERGFLSERGIAFILQAATVSITAGPAWSWKPLAWAEAAHRSISRCFAALLPPEQADVMTGLVLGYKGPLPFALNRAIQDAGVMHLLVPSGAKVAFVMLALLGAGLRLGLSMKSRMLLAGVLGGFYTLMVGAEPPYARAYLGSLALFAGRFLDRESGIFQGLVLSALIILIAEPRALFGAGFQMTYAASSGLLLAMPRLNALRAPPWVRHAAQTLVASLVVQAMLWPLFAQIFHRGSLIGAAANLLLIPSSFIMMAAGFLAWFFWLAGAARGLALAVLTLKFLSALFIRACFWFAAVPGAAMDLRPMPWTALAGYYLISFAVLAVPGRKVFLAGLAGAVLWAGPVLWSRIRGRDLKVVYLHIARGQAAVVSFPEGGHWLVYGGGSPALVARSLKALGVSRLDKAVLTDGRGWKGLARLARVFPTQQVERCESAPFQIRRGAVVFDFQRPRVRRLYAEYSIMASRLRLGAVEVATDGDQVSLTDAR